MKTILPLNARHFLSMVAIILASATVPALAVPSFARQTGFECTACHLSWPELTSVGRSFKLGGYTLQKPGAAAEHPLVSFSSDTEPPVVPLAAFVQVSSTKTSNTHSDGTDSSTFPDDGKVVVQQASLFLAGRITEHIGTFAQWTYDGQAHHSAIDNTEIRYADRYRGHDLDVVFGLSLNNNPTMSDIYNSTPVWGFPYAGSSVAPTPAASTMVQEGLAQQVAGLSAYSMWNRTVYVEFGGYRTASGALSLFRAGADRSTSAVLSGTAPYWRLALQRDWDEGNQSAMLGAYGLSARKYPDPLQPTGPTDSFRDVAIDAQYQYVTDLHRFSGQWTHIRESQTLDATFAAGASEKLGNSLSVTAGKVSYYYDRKYGVSVGYQRISGSTDTGLYDTGEAAAGSVNASPDSSAVTLELNWLPWRDRRFTLQYTGYQKFNGAKSNYDGFGRNAKDNNTLYLLAWLMF